MTQATRVEEIQSWWSTDQQKHFNRTYSAELISVLREEIAQNYISSYQGRKLYNVLHQHRIKVTASLNFGVTDVLQYDACADAGMDTAYVSGAICSISDTPTGDVGADMADYPYSTVPDKVSKMTKSALHHSKIERLTSYMEGYMNRDVIDKLVPIIADADSGHGGLTATMKLTKLFVESGAAAIHLDDQVSGTKKFKAKTAGRVMVPVSEHIARLKAAKMQIDIMGSDMLLFHRTDAETAGYLTSTIDSRDKPFILGQVPDQEDLVPLAVAVKKQAPEIYESFIKETKMLNLSGALNYLRKAGVLIDWDHESPRSFEGWYRYNGCVEAAIVRAIACAPYSDLVWSRTAVTDWKAAAKFSVEVQKAFPGKLMGFNVFAAVDEEHPDTVDALARLGYVWQFWPLGGLHAAGIQATRVSQVFKNESIEGFYKKIRKGSSSSVLDYGWFGGLINDVVIAAINSE